MAKVIIIANTKTITKPLKIVAKARFPPSLSATTPITELKKSKVITIQSNAINMAIKSFKRIMMLIHHPKYVQFFYQKYL